MRTLSNPYDEFVHAGKEFIGDAMTRFAHFEAEAEVATPSRRAHLDQMCGVQQLAGIADRQRAAANLVSARKRSHEIVVQMAIVDGKSTLQCLLHKQPAACFGVVLFRNLCERLNRSAAFSVVETQVVRIHESHLQYGKVLARGL